MSEGDRAKVIASLKRIRMGIDTDARVRVTNAMNEALLNGFEFEMLKTVIWDNFLEVPEGIEDHPDYQEFREYVDEIIFEKYEQFKKHVNIALFPKRSVK